jgi:diguanylate cyclase (GGDEF)-like protein
VARAEHLVKVVRESPMRMPGGDLLALSVSIGVAHAPLPHDDETMLGLFAEADAALYNAKRAGRDRVGVPTGASRDRPSLSA